MKLSTATAAALFAGVPLALVACAHPAYGPDSDSRLEAAVADDKKSAQSEEGVARQLSERSCGGDKKKLTDAEQDDKPDADRLKEYIRLYTDLLQRQKEIDKLIRDNPGAEFAGDGKTASQTLEECIALIADTHNSFDKFLREVVEVPISKEFQGTREVSVARVEFSLLRQAIDTLNPDDRENLSAKLDNAEHKLGPATGAGGGSGKGKKK
jgi:hypothetical protein